MLPPGSGWAFTHDEDKVGWVPYVDDMLAFQDIDAAQFEVLDPGEPTCHSGGPCFSPLTSPLANHPVVLKYSVRERT